jgi:hypothetical protein
MVKLYFGDGFTDIPIPDTKGKFALLSDFKPPRDSFPYKRGPVRRIASGGRLYIAGYLWSRSPFTLAYNLERA